MQNLTLAPLLPWRRAGVPPGPQETHPSQPQLSRLPEFPSEGGAALTCSLSQDAAGWAGMKAALQKSQTKGPAGGCPARLRPLHADAPPHRVLTGPLPGTWLGEQTHPWGLIQLQPLPRTTGPLGVRASSPENRGDRARSITMTPEKQTKPPPPSILPRLSSGLGQTTAGAQGRPGRRRPFGNDAARAWAQPPQAPPAGTSPGAPTAQTRLPGRPLFRSQAVGPPVQPPRGPQGLPGLGLTAPSGPMSITTVALS